MTYLDARVTFSLDLLLKLQKKKKEKKASIESLVPLLCVAHSAASFPTYPHLRFPNFHTFTLPYQKFAGNTQQLPLTK